MDAFPPEDISGFLELSAGEWFALRSLLGTDATEAPQANTNEVTTEQDKGHHWHQSERGELKVDRLPPLTSGDWGGLEVHLPGGGRCTLIFQRDGSLVMDEGRGRWSLAKDGILVLEIVKETCVVNERVWFSKPNLRLRCTLELCADGQPGRASFSSEIRRVLRDPAPSRADRA